MFYSSVNEYSNSQVVENSLQPKRDVGRCLKWNDLGFWGEVDEFYGRWFPSRFKVESSQTCVFHMSMLSKTNDETILGPRIVGPEGWRVWRT
jgi:hypothetical protein